MTTKVPLQPPPQNLDSQSLELRVREMARWMYEVYRRMFDTGLLSILWSSLTRTTKITSVSLTVSTDVTKVTAPCTITLPTAVGQDGRSLVIDNAHAGSTLLYPVTGELIEGEPFQTLIGHCAIDLYSDGTGWRVI